MIKLRISKSFRHLGYDVWLVKYEQNGPSDYQGFISEPIVWRPFAAGEQWPQPNLEIDARCLDFFFDELEFSGIIQEYKKRYKDKYFDDPKHIEDLRQVTTRLFGLLETKLK